MQIIFLPSEAMLGTTSWKAIYHCIQEHWKRLSFARSWKSFFSLIVTIEEQYAKGHQDKISVFKKELMKLKSFWPLDFFSTMRGMH